MEKENKQPISDKPFLTQIESLLKYTEDCVEIAPIIDRKFLNKYIYKDIKKTILDVDILNTELLRSIRCLNGDNLVVLDIDYHDEKDPRDSLTCAIRDARKIEKRFPLQFLWVFTGGGIHGIAIFRSTKENLKNVRKFGSIFSFIKSVIDYIGETAEVKLDRGFVRFKGLVRCIGSYHKKSGLFCVPILDLDKGVDLLVNCSAKKIIPNYEIPDLDIDNFLKSTPVYDKNFMRYPKAYSWKKIEVNFDMYPECIKTMMNLSRKGNGVRFDLLRYFFNLHTKERVDFLMKQILNSEEYNHMKFEGQFEHIYMNNYSPPNHQRLKSKGYCGKNCNIPNPIFVSGLKDIEEESEENVRG